MPRRGAAGGTPSIQCQAAAGQLHQPVDQERALELAPGPGRGDPTRHPRQGEGGLLKYGVLI